MTMKMLVEGGLELLTDGIRTADDSNPEGYYEFEKVKELNKARDLSWLNGARGKAVKVISYLLPHLPDTLNYRVIFMHRNLHEVIASQNKMLVQRDEPAGTDDDHMLALFEERDQLQGRPRSAAPAGNADQPVPGWQARHRADGCCC
jgi:hypothetical protein